MRQQLLVLGLGFVLSSASPALAVQPATVRANDNVPWSTVVNNPFDGKVVYDRNYRNDYAFVSSWSQKGIGVTYIQVRSTLVGHSYSAGPRFGIGYSPWRRRGGLGVFFDQSVPVYQQTAVENVPDSISLAINGKVYTYESGPVSPELAAALASAPEAKVAMRLNWKDGTTRDTEIGRDTVRAWKVVFSSPN